MEDQDYILFEDYLSGKLSADEVAAFENRINSDEKFKDAFNSYKELSSFLAHKFENEEATNAFKTNLQSISATHFNKEENQETVKTTKTYTLLKYLVAACVVLVFGIFTLNQFSAPSYADYAEYDTISLTVRGAENKLLQTAENAFNSRDFEKADEAFKHLLENDDNNVELKLYRGIANIELNNFETADSLLQDVMSGATAYKHKAAWYLALSKLKQKNEMACLKILKQIPSESDNYRKAQELIKKLD